MHVHVALYSQKKPLLTKNAYNQKVFVCLRDKLCCYVTLVYSCWQGTTPRRAYLVTTNSV